MTLNSPEYVPSFPWTSLWHSLLTFCQRSGIIIHEAKTRPKPKDQAKCPLFAVIPVEIRHMIYAQLLTTPSVIDQAHKQLGSRESAMLDQYVPIPNIDATILRVCRLIYVEALPTLYGLNVFKFSSAQSIRHFQNHGLSTYPLGRPCSQRYRLLVLSISILFC